jgi:M6 family metalloprotease-like protein
MSAWAAALLLCAQAAEAPKPRRSLVLAVVPLSFPDQAFAGNPARDLIRPLADYYRRASGAAFEVSGKAWDPVGVPVMRPEVRRADLEAAARAFVAREGAAVLETFDALCFAAAGGMGTRGSALWPHQDTVEVAARRVPYLLVPGNSGPRGVAAAAHELMHVLGIEDKYDDAKADVGADCILGTGFDPKDPPPPCGECRVRLGWTRPVDLDASKAGEASLERGQVARVELAPGEALLLELRDELLVWHTGGGKRVERVAKLASGGRLTPYSEPAFRGRSPGARVVWITEVRIAEGRAAFRVGPEAVPTAAEEERRLRVGKRLGQ